LIKVLTAVNTDDYLSDGVWHVLDICLLGQFRVQDITELLSGYKSALARTLVNLGLLCRTERQHFSKRLPDDVLDVDPVAARVNALLKSLKVVPIAEGLAVVFRDRLGVVDVLCIVLLIRMDWSHSRFHASGAVWALAALQTLAYRSERCSNRITKECKFLGLLIGPVEVLSSLELG